MKKERGFSYWPLFGLAALVAFLCFCCFEIWAIPVYADGPTSHPDTTHSVTLTPAQTVALFGTQLNALVKLDPNTNTQTAITFDFAFPASQIGWLDEGGAFGYASNNTLPSNINNQMTPSEFVDAFCGSDYLVYVADASQWGSSRVYPLGVVQGSGDYDIYQNLVEQGTVPSAQIHVPFSISLSGITGYYQSVFYSSSYPVNYSNPSWWSYNCLTLLTDTLHTRYFSMSGVSQYGVIQQYLAPMPIYGHTGNRNTVDETRMGRFAGWCIDEYDDLDAEFDVNGFTIDALMLSSVAPSSGNYNLWLLVGCPTLYDYNPPVVTTTRAPETYPTQTFPTGTYPTGTSYDPHKIIIDNQNTQIMQLNLIIGQLDRIYNRMVNSGQIAVNLMPAEPLADLRTDIHTQIHDSLSSFTTSQIPINYRSDMNGSFSFVNSLYTKFTSDGLAFFGWLGIFSLTMYVVIWFIFRGRG